MSIPRQSRVAAVTTMVGLTTLAALALIPAPDAPAPAHAQSRIDFGRDIQPLLKERCYECHGPTKQMNGYRLDQRSRALAGVVRPNIIRRQQRFQPARPPRASVAEFGTQMPPEDELSADEIAILKRWIDEGAHWPDALANERPLPPEEPPRDARRRTDSIARATLPRSRKYGGRRPSSTNPALEGPRR